MTPKNTKAVKPTIETEIAVLKDNVEDLKTTQEKFIQHEVRLSLTERALQESRTAQEKILANTEKIMLQQQEITKTLSLLEQAQKNQGREIGGLKENVEHKANQKDFEELKESTDTRINDLRDWTESRLKWLVVTFLTVVSVVTGILAVIK